MTIFDAEEGTGDGVSVTTSNSGWSTVGNGVSASTIFSTAGRFNGNYGYRLTTPSAQSWAYVRWAGNAVSTNGPYRVRFYYRYTARPASGVEGRIIRILRSSGTQTRVTLYQLANGGISLRTNGTTTATETTVFNSSVALAVNTWYRIELVINPGSTTSNGTVGLGITVGQAALTTTNSGNNVYYYSAALNLGGNAGISSIDLGRTETGTAYIAWGVTMDLDAVQIDNVSFTSAPSTWIGPNTFTFSSVLALAAVSTFDNFFSFVQRQNGISMVAAFDELVVNPSAITSPAALVMTAAFDDAIINPTVLRLGTVPAAALAALSVTPAAGTLTAALSMGVTPAMALAGQKVLSALWSASVPASLAVGALRTQLATLGLNGAGALALEVTGLFQDTWLSGAVGSFVIPNTDVSHRYVMPFDAMGGIVMAGLQNLPYLWPARATPTLQVVGTGSRSVALSMRGTPALTVTGRDLTFALVPLTAAGKLAVAGVSVGDLINYDFVKALILRRDVAVVLFFRDSAAKLRDNGRRRAKLRPVPVGRLVRQPVAARLAVNPRAKALLLEGQRRKATILPATTRAKLLPGGMLARIQE